MYITQKLPSVTFSRHGVHNGWVGLVRGLKDSGVAPELNAADLTERLGGGAVHPPDADSAFELVDGFLQGDGDSLVGLRRKSQARYVAHRASEGTTAQKLVVRLAIAAPELGRLGIFDDPSLGTLALRAERGKAPIPLEDVETESILVGSSVFCRRVVSVEGLMAAANRILTEIAAPFRFVPLKTPDDAVAYVGVSAAAAAILDNAGALDEPLAELRGLSDWDEQTMALALRAVA